MSYFGETIRKAREAKGMTTSQIAEKTHILVQIINAMEHEDFSQIKAAIYGRGFVKLVCECLDLDPKPLVAEFMDIYEGRRPPVTDFFQPKQPPPAFKPAMPDSEPIPVAEQIPPPEPAPVVEPVPVVESTPITEPAPIVEPVPQPEPAIVSTYEPQQTSGIVEAAIPGEEPTTTVVPETVKGLDLFDPQSQAQDVPTATRAQDIFSSVYSNYEQATPSTPSAAEKFRTGLSVVSHGVLGSVRNIPRSAWRIAVLVVGALIVIGLIVWGCVILYRVTEQPLATGDPQSTQPPIVPASKPDINSVTPQPVVTSPAKPATGSTTQQAKPTSDATKQQAKPASDATKQQTKPVSDATKQQTKPVSDATKQQTKPVKPKQVAQPQKKQPVPAAKPKLRSTGQKIPPLYVD